MASSRFGINVPCPKLVFMFKFWSLWSTPERVQKCLFTKSLLNITERTRIEHTSGCFLSQNKEKEYKSGGLFPIWLLSSLVIRWHTPHKHTIFNYLDKQIFIWKNNILIDICIFFMQSLFNDVKWNFYGVPNFTFNSQKCKYAQCFLPESFIDALQVQNPIDLPLKQIETVKQSIFVQHLVVFF